MIIQMPNLTYVNFTFRWFLDKAGVLRHNRKVMNPQLLQSMAKDNGLEQIVVGFWKPFAFWSAQKNHNFMQAFAYKRLRWLTKKMTKFEGHKGLRYFSPYLYLVATKPLEQQKHVKKLNQLEVTQ